MVVNKSLVAIVAASAAIAIGAAETAGAGQDDLIPNTKVDGPTLTFDWPAVEVGVASYEEGPTGVTVIRFPQRVSVAVDVRGGGPGTVNTDGLRLGYGQAFTDAIVFSGGSSYGEEAITAVQTGLKDDGVRSGDLISNVAFVPGAIIYDFGWRLNSIYPDKRLAQTALRAARPGMFPLGAQGAGRMAMQGSYFGCTAHSGQGGAFRQVGPTKIAAFVVVNAFGVVTDRAGRLASCNRAKSWGNLETTSELLRHLPTSLKADWDAEAARQQDSAGTRNTTVSLVVTSQKLGHAALQRLAIQVHTSMARAIQPFSTEYDGDTLFAASTQETDDNELGALTMTTLAAEASETMWDAVLASVPENGIFTPLAKSPPAIRAETLAIYAGTYEFGEESTAAGGLGVDFTIVDAPSRWRR
jgi:L-aminopeptidase/D-esterase-like protein